jgi:hypothetical protein
MGEVVVREASELPGRLDCRPHRQESVVGAREFVMPTLRPSTGAIQPRRAPESPGRRAHVPRSEVEQLAERGSGAAAQRCLPLDRILTPAFPSPAPRLAPSLVGHGAQRSRDEYCRRLRRPLTRAHASVLAAAAQSLILQPRHASRSRADPCRRRPHRPAAPPPRCQRELSHVCPAMRPRHCRHSCGDRRMHWLPPRWMQHSR